MKELTEDNFETVLAQNENVVVQYGAAWCGACRVVKPKFSTLSDEYDNVEFYYVDAEKFPKAREFAKIENLPTFATFKSGELVKQVLGSNIEKIKGAVDEIASN